LGFVSFLDPAKKGIAEVLRSLNEIGIEVKIITGDNELVTQKICGDVGMDIKGTLTGRDIDHLTDSALQVRALENTVFARCSPIQKTALSMRCERRGG